MLDCLDEFAEQHSKIRIIRSREHVGIIKNRISGAVNAKGPVLVFLDSHVEVMYGWLEPLLARFVYHHDVLATVFSLRVNGDSMKFDTFNIDKPQHFGGVTWKLEFYGDFFKRTFHFLQLCNCLNVVSKQYSRNAH